MKINKKIAMLFPYAPSYREPIYTLMDKTLGIDWFFCGNAERNLRMLDYTILRNCDLSMKETKVLGSIVSYTGIKQLNLKNYDAIICAGVIRSLSEWWLLGKCGRGMKAPKIYLWTHGWYGKESWIQTIIKKIFFSRVDGFFLYGDYAKIKMLKEGFDGCKLHVIKNSLDYDKQLEIRNNLKSSSVYRDYFRNDNPTIIFIGRLTRVKKLDQIIDAIHLLKKNGQLYNLVFVGDGGEYNSLKTKVLDLNIATQVWFYGACFEERINAELIYNADLCVAPGNIGLTAIHVLMFGCPAISHNEFKWQMPEFESIKPGRTGDFFKYNDVEDLAKVISRWFANKQNCREDIRQACYKEIDKYWNPHYQLNVIKNVLEIE